MYSICALYQPSCFLDISFDKKNCIDPPVVIYKWYSIWHWIKLKKPPYTITLKSNLYIYIYLYKTLLILWWKTWVLIFSHRHLLHHCFQALMDHGVKVASVLANSFSRRCSYIAESDAHVKEKAIQFGFVLGMAAVAHFSAFQLVITSCCNNTLLGYQVAFYQMPAGMEMQRKSTCLVSSCAHYTMRFFTGIVQWSVVWGEWMVSSSLFYTEQNYKRNTYVFAPIFH